MSKQNTATAGDTIHISVGEHSKNVAAGKDVTQNVTEQVANFQVTTEDLSAVKKIFAELKEQVPKEISSEMQPPAIERIDELEEAITGEKPDLTTMEYVKNWFTKKLPQFAGKIISVLVNPIVGKVVEAGGEIAAAELKERFGKSD